MPIPPPLLPLLAAAAATGLLVPLLARGAARLGLLDRPGARSTHVRPVPRVGGLAALGGLAAGLAVAGATGHAALDDAAVWMPWLLSLGAFALIGVADDRLRLRAAPKGLLQVAAAALAVGLGLRWAGEGTAPWGGLAFGAATPAMTGLWILAVVVTVNFLDGIDLIASATVVVVLGAAAGAGAGPGGGLLFALAAAAVVGFGPWNGRPARAFLGDAGTHALGFLVAAAALHVPGHGAALPWPLASAPLLPAVIDVGLGLLAKARRGVPLARAHRQHLYQRLTRVGWSHAAVAARFGALALAALLVASQADAWGTSGVLAVAAPVLGGHLLHAGLRTRRLPWTFTDDAAAASQAQPEKG